MTKADEMNLMNLMDNVRKMDNAVKMENNSEEIARIRQYCIDAVRDYRETNRKICDLINANRDLWKDPYIKGSYDGFVDGKPYRLGETDFYHNYCPFVFTSGTFSIAEEIGVIVSGITGNKQRTGYCGHFEDHDIVSKDWKAEEVFVEDTSSHTDNPWYHDLIGDTFDGKNSDGTTERSLHYTEENLVKYNWSIDGWTNMKKMADKTRKRTEAIVKRFRKALEDRIAKNTERLNNLSSSSETSNYTKVQF